MSHHSGEEKVEYSLEKDIKSLGGDDNESSRVSHDDHSEHSTGTEQKLYSSPVPNNSQEHLVNEAFHGKIVVADSFIDVTCAVKFLNSICYVEYMRAYYY